MVFPSCHHTVLSSQCCRQRPMGLDPGPPLSPPSGTPGRPPVGPPPAPTTFTQDSVPLCLDLGVRQPLVPCLFLRTPGVITRVWLQRPHQSDHSAGPGY